MRPCTSALALALLVPALAGAGCLGLLTPEPPEDPTAFAYHYRADDDRKAPHPAAFTGTYRELAFTGVTATARVDGVTVEAPRFLEDANLPEWAPRPQGAAVLTIRDATGTFTPDEGNATAFEARTIAVTAGDDFTLTGVARVDATALTFRGREARVHALPVPDVMPHPEAGPAGPTLHVADAGAVARDVRVTWASADATPHTGTLRLEPGAYPAGGGTLLFTPVAPVDVTGERARVTVDAEARPTLRGERVDAGVTVWDAVNVTARVDAADTRADVTMDVVQFWSHERPQLEAALDASFHGADAAERAVTLARGENATYWVRVDETSRVGSAVNVHPRLEEGALNATWSPDWYARPDPGVLESIGHGLKQVFLGWLVDFSVRDFDPGERGFIALHVEVPEDAEPGEHVVTGRFNGDNARSGDVRLVVTVT